MDDLKLYGKNDHEQYGQLKIVKQFSGDIGLTFELEKPVSRKVHWCQREILR